MTSTSITIQWDQVPCIEQNSEITGYIVVSELVPDERLPAEERAVHRFSPVSHEHETGMYDIVCTCTVYIVIYII